MQELTFSKVGEHDSNDYFSAHVRQLLRMSLTSKDRVQPQFQKFYQ